MLLTIIKKIYFQVRVRADDANQFSMSIVIVCFSNGKTWMIHGSPFDGWTKYSTGWYKLVPHDFGSTNFAKMCKDY